MPSSIGEDYSQAPSDITVKISNNTQLQALPFSVSVPATHLVSQSSPLTSLPFEILEALLLDLPAQDLLLSQSVCRTFRGMVVLSKSIRRALFLEPEHYSGKLENWKVVKWNPFLESHLSSLLSIRAIGVHRSREGPVKMVAHARIRDEVFTDPDLKAIFLRDPASWKEMLVTQPPATLLMHPSASLFWASSIEDQAQFFHNSAGFRFEDIVSCDLVEKLDPQEENQSRRCQRRYAELPLLSKDARITLPAVVAGFVTRAKTKEHT